MPCRQIVDAVFSAFDLLMNRKRKARFGVLRLLLRRPADGASSCVFSDSDRKKITAGSAVFFAAFIALFFVGSLNVADAQTYYTWRSENPSGNGNLDYYGNWWNFNTSSQSAWGFGQQEFDNNVQTANNANNSLSTWRILFKSGANQARTFTGNTIRFYDYGGQNGGIWNDSSATHVFNNNLEGDGSTEAFQINIGGSGGLTFGGTINNQGTAINVVGGTASATTVTFNGVISGTGGFYKENANITVVMTNANTYSGQTTIQNGVLRLQGIGSLANSAVRLQSGGTLQISNNATVSSVAEYASGNAGVIAISNGATLTVTANDLNIFQNSISGGGGLTKQGSHTLSLYGTQSYTGTTTVSAGKLGTSVALSSGSFVLDGGLFETTTANAISDTASFTLGGGTFSIGGAETFGNNGVTLTASTTSTVSPTSGNTATISGALTGSGNLTKGDSGTLILSGNSTGFTGNTTVSAGTLQLGNGNALGSSGTVSVSTGARLQLSNDITVSRNLVLNADGISYSGSLQNVSGNNTWSGSISNNGGTTGARINSDSGTLTIGGNISSGSTNLYIGGAGNVTVNGTVSGTQTSGNGALYKDGAGTLTLSANNSGLTGLFRITGGSVAITNGNSLGTGSVEFGSGSTLATLLINSNTTVANRFEIANNSSNASINVASGQTATYSGVLSQTNGTANTTKFGKSGAGTLILNGGGSAYSGQIQIGEGTVIIGANNSLSTNVTTVARGVDLGLNVGDVSQANNVALLLSNGVTLSNSIYVAPNTTSATRTIGMSGTGAASFTNEIYLDGTLDVTAESGANATISGNIVKNSGGAGGGLTKTGAGTVTLSGANTYVGTTYVNAGTLVAVGAATNAASLGAGSLVLNGGNLSLLMSSATPFGRNTTLSNNATITVDRDILSSGLAATMGTLAMSGAQTLTIAKGSNMTNGGTVNFGATTLSSNGAEFSVQTAAATLSLTNGITGSGYSFTISGAGITLISNTIATGAGGATKTGTGALILMGSNSLSGGILLNQGKLTLGNSYALGTGTFTIGSIGGSAVSLNATSTTATNAQNNTIQINSNFDYNNDGGSATTYNFGTGAVTLGTNVVATVKSNLVIGGVIGDGGFGRSLTKAGVGLVTLTASNTYSGGTIVSAGTLALSGSGALRSTSSVSNAATFDISAISAASTTIGSLQGAGAVALGAKRLVFGDANNTTISGIFSGAGGAITKQGAGTVTLSGENTYTGGTTLNLGTILIGTAGSGSVGSITSSSIGTGTLAFNGGRISSSGTTARTINNAVTVGGNVAVGDATNTGALTFAGGVDLGGSTRTITIDSAATMSGTISNGGITKSGASTLTLSGANTFASGLLLNTGGLNINNAGALGSGTFTINGGTFIDNTSGGAISNTANNAMSWGGNFTYTGSTNLDLGTGAVTLTGSRQVTVSSNALTVGGAIGGAYTLTKAGAGTLILAGANTYTNTTISAGTLALIGSASLTAVTNGASGIFDISGVTTSATLGSLGSAGAVNLGSKRLIVGDANSTTISGIISGSGGAITKQGNGTLTLSGGNTYSGGTVVSAGTLAGSTTSLQGPITNNAAVIFDQGTNGTYAGVISGSGSLAKTNSGTVTLTGANTFSGGTFINGGTLALSGSGTLLSTGAISNAGTLNISGVTPEFVTFGSLQGSGAVNIGAKALIVGDANNTTVSGIISGTGGSLVKQGSGTLTLSNANNSYSGKTTINAGTISISAERNLGSNPGSATADAITMNGGVLETTASFTNTSNRGVMLDGGGGTFRVASGTTFGITTTTSPGISGAGGLTKTGAGTLSFNQYSNNTFTGDFLVNEGVVYAFSRGGLVFGATNTGSLVLNGGVVQLAGGPINYGRSVVVNSNATFLIDRTDANQGVIQSLGGLTIGGQTLTVNGANSTAGGSANRLAFSGAVTVSGGAPTFVVNYDATTTNFAGLIFSNTVDNGGQLLTFIGNGNIEAQAMVSGEGGILKQGTGTLILGGANTYTGGTAISNGSVLVANTNALQSTTLELAASSTMKFTNALTGANVGMIKGSGDFGLTNLGGQSVSLTIGTNNGSQTYSGVMSGGGSLTKIGNGTFTLTGTNTYTGTTTVREGDLKVNGAIASSSTVVTNSGTLSGSGSIAGTTTIKDGGTISPGNSPGTISVTNLVFGTNGNYNWQLYDATAAAGTGYDTISGSGSLNITANGTDKFNINLWTLSSISPDANGSAINFLSSSNYSWTLGTWAGGITNFNANYFSLNLSATNGTGGFANSYSGAFSLTSSNNSIFLNYLGAAGGPPIYAGTSGNWSTGFSPALTQGATNAIFSGAGGAATNDIASASVNTIGTLTFSNTAGSYTLTANSGSAGFNAASALAITGNIVNNSASAQTINLALGFSNASSINAASGNMTFGGSISNGTSLTFTGASNNTVSGTISGAGALIKDGTGTLTLADNNSYGGATTISNGTVTAGVLANAGSNSSLGTNSTVTLAGSTASSAILNYTGGNVATDRNFVANNGGGTINMASSNTVVTLTGSSSGSGKLVVGEGTLVLSNTTTADSFAPGSIQVDSGATLQLAANNQIGNSTGLILNGGTFRVGTESTGFSDTLGTLTLSATSTIDLGSYGTGLRTLTFANSSAITWTGNLIITNWQGVAQQSSDVAQILFGTGGLTSAQLGQIVFANQGINGGELIGGGQLVPIPEPRVYLAAIALLGAIGWRERKRVRTLLGLRKKASTL